MRRAIFPVVAGGLTMVSVAGAEPVDFRLISQNVAVDKIESTAKFELIFDRAPDFTTGDAQWQMNAFQYEIDSDWNGKSGDSMSFGEIDAVIRGTEIWEGQGVPVRQSEGAGGINAGGWGPVKDFLPYQLDGQTLTFVTPLSSLGDTDGKFRYHVFTTENGAMTSEAADAVVPLPTSVWTGLVMLGGIGLAKRLKMLRPVVG